MTGTWTQTGPGRSVYRPAGPDDWKIPEDALHPYVDPVILAAMQRAQAFWAGVWERLDRMAAERERSRLSETLLGHVVAQEDIRAGDVLDIVLDRDTGAVRAERHRVRVTGVQPGDGPGDVVLDLASLTWTCMVCGDERPDAQISVAHRQIPGMEDRFPDGARVNVRYCNDRPDCVATATATGVWPAP